MTPKEKAEELVYKYKDAPFNCTGCDMPYCDIPCTMLNIGEAKQCALIAVDEVIKVCPYYSKEGCETIEQLRANDYEFVTYWEEVKQEIEKL